ncbi:MAG: SusC/RagA family TonB-linked outer membrane protein [Chryseobacterium sp.]|nr:MAG: SusC/RagA family TonB-linked outer membrane protein [Chryseobacterium sp.]
MKYFCILFFLLPWCLDALAQKVVRGQVVSVTGNKPLPKASIYLEPQHIGIPVDSAGRFTLHSISPKSRLSVSHLGYITKSILLDSVSDTELIVVLEEQVSQLEQVTVQTGYQTITKERATGSFVKVDNELLNRRVSNDIISRLQDVVPGLTFNSVATPVANQTSISIRGQSTLSSRTDPLIIVDNFPFEGDMNNINPNDVEDITILKDAAAASIWGAKSGNGVIVITTKKGKLNSGPKVSLNANLNIGARPDLFYLQTISPSTFIDIEAELFTKGFYNSREASVNKTALNPVVELLIARRDGKLSSEVADRQISMLRTNDIRKDYEKYVYQLSEDQQYALNVSGGSANQRYFISAGYDRNMPNLKGNMFQRISFNANNSLYFLSNKLEVTTSVYFLNSNQTQNNNQGINSAAYSTLYPYAQLADGEGKALAVTKDFRRSFTQLAEENGLLDWSYRPLDEIGMADNSSKQNEYRINANLIYKVIPELSLAAYYQYGHNNSISRNRQDVETYFTRNLINTYTIASPDGSLQRPIPMGDILDQRTSITTNHHVRAIANFDKSWSGVHGLNAIAGMELSDRKQAANGYRLYGYDGEHATSQMVNYISNFTSYINPAQTTLRIQNNDSNSELIDRFVSYYTNMAYNFRGRYTFSASARIDNSNLFGVDANQRGVPLYSLGLGWEASREDFYELDFLPYLRLRLTFGYNGNVNKSISAYTTAYYYGANSYNLPYASILNPPNPELRWERVRVGNLAVDFRTKNNRIEGTLEYYRKNGIDLIGRTPYAPQTGITTFVGNNASTKGQGLDLSLVTRNTVGKLKWTSNILFSSLNEKVSKYGDRVSGTTGYLGTYSITPTVGKPIYAIYSFESAGLDPINGNPRGFLNGNPATDYGAIIAASNAENMVYHGSARPTIYGALRNTFSVGSLSLSANISYSLGYYFRKESVNFDQILNGNGGHSDYDLRWRKPGDEVFTNIPSLPMATNASRNLFYSNSSTLVDKGDHIRLRDLQLDYVFQKRHFPNLPFQQIRCYVFINNIGIIWKATDSKLDPDYQTRFALPPVRTYAFGLQVNL